MSTTLRWIVAVLLILLGLAAAAFALFGGAFSTVACTKTPPDWVYYILLIAGILTLAAGVVPAVLLLRRAKAMHTVLTLGLGIILSCVGYGAYLAVLGEAC